MSLARPYQAKICFPARPAVDAPPSGNPCHKTCRIAREVAHRVRPHGRKTQIHFTPQCPPKSYPVGRISACQTRKPHSRIIPQCQPDRYYSRVPQRKAPPALAGGVSRKVVEGREGYPCDSLVASSARAASARCDSSCWLSYSRSTQRTATKS